MADSPTTRNRFRKQSLGSNLNVWGDPYLNDNFDLIDFSLDGQSTIAISTTSTTLTSVNYAPDQARSRMLILTGTLTANSTVIIPSVEKIYDVVSSVTMGAFTLIIKTATGVGANIPAGGCYLVTCDGTDSDVRRTLDYGSLEVKNIGTATADASAARFGQVKLATENRSMGGYLLSGVGTATATDQAVNFGLMSAAIALAGAGTGGGAIRVTATDTQPNFLSSKLAAGSGISFAVENPGGAEVYRATVATLVGGDGTSAGTGGLAPAPGTGAVDGYLLRSGTFSGTGAITQGTHLIPIIATGLVPETTAGPSLGSSETSSNKVMDVGLDYDPTTIEGAQTTFPLPSSYNGSAVALFLYARAVGTATGDAVFQASAQYQRPGIDPPDGAWSTPVTTTFTGLSSAAYAISGTMTGITPAGTYAAGAALLLRVQRLGTSASDTLSADARLRSGGLLLGYNAGTDA